MGADGHCLKEERWLLHRNVGHGEFTPPAVAVTAAALGRVLCEGPGELAPHPGSQLPGTGLRADTAHRTSPASRETLQITGQGCEAPTRAYALGAHWGGVCVHRVRGL